MSTTQNFYVFVYYVPENHPNVVCNASSFHRITVDTLPPKLVLNLIEASVVSITFSETEGTRLMCFQVIDHIK